MLGVARASDGLWVIPPELEVKFPCVTDLLGFCYSDPINPVDLPFNDTYYFVSSEVAGGDLFLNMEKSATGADYSNYRSKLF